VVDIRNREPRLTLLTSWVGDTAVADGRRLFAAQQIPTYATPEQAVRAFMYLVNYRRNQETLMETPPSVPEAFAPDRAAAQRILATALAEGRTWLFEHEAKALLDAYGVPVAPTRLARSAEEAAAIAAQLGGPVVLKIVAPEITHKSDVGGVALDLVGPAAVRAAADTMRERVHAARPDAGLVGFSVQPMVRRPGACELIVGATEDRQFGPVLLFGQGGTTAELVKDQALALPPLNMHLAHEVMSRTRVHEVLQGYRGAPPANLDALALTLVRVAQLVTDHAEVRELDVNPLLADAYGVIALDARVRVGKATRPATDRLAIRPYPRELEEEIPLGDGRILLLRPIRPEDEPALQAAFANMTAEEIRLRFLVPVKTLSHVAAVRFTQIDYDREMGLVLTEPGIPGRSPIHGVVNVIADPDNERAEYAIIIRHEMTALGLGTFLMRRIVDYARARGIGEIYGDVLRENRPMLRLCKALGFTESRMPDEPSLVRVTLRLQGE
jgi:acetyltransferase